MTDPRNIVNDPIPNPPAHAAEVPKKDHLLTNKLYNIIKFLAMTLLPAAGTLYFTLSGLWGLPNTEQVIGSITAVDLFLGVLLGISSNSYKYSSAKYDGTIEVDKADTGKTMFTLALDTPTDELEDKEEVVFNVHKNLPK